MEAKSGSKMPPFVLDVDVIDAVKKEGPQALKELVQAGVFNDEELFNNVFCVLCELGMLQGAQLLCTQKVPSKEVYLRAFNSACGGGHGRVIDWLTPNVDRAALEASKFYCAKAACEQGHIIVLAQLIRQFNIKADEMNAGEMMAIACARGHLPIAQYLAEKFGLKSDCFYSPGSADGPKYNYLLSLCANQGKNPNIAKVATWMLFGMGFRCEEWELESIFNASFRSGEPSLPPLIATSHELFTLKKPNVHFNDCCLLGDQDTLIWFIRRFNFDVQSISQGDADFLCVNLAYRGHAAVLMWLIETLTPEKFSPKSAAVAIESAARCDAELSQWLISAFGTEVEKKVNYGVALKKAAANGNEAAVNAILQKIKPSFFDALEALCIMKKGNLNILRAIYREYRDRFSAADIDKAVRAACRRGDFEVVRTCIEDFGFKSWPLDHPALIKEAACINLELLSWLVDTFPLSRDEAREVLKDCCLGDNIMAARIIDRKYDFTLEEARAEQALAGAVQSGGKRVCKWLVWRFPQMRLEDSMGPGCSAWQIVAEFNLKETRDWIISTFGSTIKEEHILLLNSE